MNSLAYSVVTALYSQLVEICPHQVEEIAHRDGTRTAFIMKCWKPILRSIGQSNIRKTEEDSGWS
ncbi:hypothetical protein FQN60_006965 [Etheostoma spectabile]|uniref:Uncharacterized protein n=1 Tax=Etheostoma spectabile TaxID=54343 RepID=A0A5J5CDI7_9PERO|nr:hypothetical protein FQN60_006965 [Etheostoma spectabile]